MNSPNAAGHRSAQALSAHCVQSQIALKPDKTWLHIRHGLTYSERGQDDNSRGDLGAGGRIRMLTQVVRERLIVDLVGLVEHSVPASRDRARFHQRFTGAKQRML